MKRLLLPISIAALIVNLGAAPVDLTPRYTDTYNDGVHVRRLYFLEGSKKIGLSIDGETEVSPSAGGVLFRFPKFPDASFRITRSPMTTADPLQEGSIDRYRAAAQQFAPRGAVETKIVEESANPLPINSWQSYQFLVSYQVGAAIQRQCVTFLNLNAEEQLVLLTTATPKNFAEAAERSFQIIRSWHEMLPEDEVANRGN